ncbi:MAG TPA: gamma-glutamyl-gamma-aminobutyrate hydrolase family protein [Gaiellales bacterium]|nr:gamma-glutamyl-gamma-aminobutyrate hydrolase family protein [Gaiellales bacterium]
MPVIGVCREMQMLNVALGGTMVQDLSLVEAWRSEPRVQPVVEALVAAAGERVAV